MRWSGQAAVLTFLVLTLFIGPAAGTPSSPPRRGADGQWEGFLTSEPGKLTLILVKLSVQQDGWTGSIDVPGAEELPLTAVRIGNDAVHFELDVDPELYVFDGQRQGDTITGQAALGEQRFPVSLRRLPELPAPADRSEAWRQDLDTVLNRFLAYDKSFSNRARKRFRRAITRVDAALPDINDPQIIVALSKAMALSGNAHTRLYLLRNRTELRRLPLRVYWFQDGLFVVRASAEHRDLAGCRVISIAGRSPRKLRKKVGRLFAGNGSWVDYKSTYFMTSPEILYGLDVIPDMKTVRFAFECADGRSLQRDLAPLPLRRKKSPTEAWRDLSPLATTNEDDEADWVSALAADATTLPLYLRHPDKHYWFEYLPDQHTLYLQYNRSQNMQTGPSFEEFSAEVLAFMKQHPTSRLVLDLRFNTGGDNSISADFIEKLGTIEKRGEIGELDVIVGRATFSAGISAAAHLKQSSGATFIGEPIGDELDTWSEGGNIVLPNSGLTVHFTNGFHSLSNVDRPENKSYLWTDLDLPDLKPDRPIELSSVDYFAGRDPVLEACLSED